MPPATWRHVKIQASQAGITIPAMIKRLTDYYSLREQQREEEKKFLNKEKNNVKSEPNQNKSR